MKERRMRCGGTIDGRGGTAGHWRLEEDKSADAISGGGMARHGMAWRHECILLV
jgi:hypothetical protein